MISPETIIILAAGVGSRLGPIGGGHAKALLEVAGRTLIDLSLDFAASVGPRARVVVVGGFEFDRLAALVRRRTDLSCVPVENRAYRAGNLLSLRAGLPHVDGGTLVMNVDHIYPDAIARRVRAMDGDKIIALCDSDRELGRDDMKVDHDGRHLRHISKELRHHRAGYVGMTFVPRRSWSAYREAVGRVGRTRGDGAHVEMVLQELADRGEEIEIGDVSGIGWHEVDTPEDYRRSAAALAP
jgi:choline kinase